MPKVHIITDSAANLSPEEAKELGVTVVPLKVQIGDERVVDGEDLDHEELMLRMASERVHPQIVGPTPEDFRRVYSRVSKETNQIISLHSSASLSTIHRSAQIASSSFLGRCDIAVMDSQTISRGLDILTRRAAHLASESVPLTEVRRQIRGIIQRVYIVLVTDTLDYLQYNGLISATQAVLGNMLEIKPFLMMEEGKIIPLEKTRGLDNAVDKLADFANEFSDIEEIAIIQSAPYATEHTKKLLDSIDAVDSREECPVLLYGPLLALHIGPDGIGLVVFEGAGQGFF